MLQSKFEANPILVRAQITISAAMYTLIDFLTNWLV